MKTQHKIIIGDSRRMSELDDQSVDLIITSPPYWQLKDYGSSNEIGFSDSYENYINNLNLVWSEVKRVLKNGCRLCINIGDQYARSVYYGRYKVIPIRTEIIKFCETIGFDYMGAIIWQKVATTHTSGGATIMGSFPFPRNGILKLDYEFILIFKKLGKSQNKVDPEIKAQSKMSTEEWNTYFSGHWKFTGEKQKKHLAMFPLELPHRLIKMFSFVGDTILDPFLGSGTTSLAASKLDRNSVGYELNSEFSPIIHEKLKIDKKSFNNPPEFQFLQQDLPKIDFSKHIKILPYIFKDPVKIKSKVDPKALQFGSKIDKNSNQPMEFYRVKQIVSPELLILNDDRKIRLIGILEDKKKSKEAINFLSKKLKGQRVFYKLDQMKYDRENNLLCYLYLQNKTFINAHLLKSRLVHLDSNYDFKQKQKFLKILSEPN